MIQETKDPAAKIQENPDSSEDVSARSEESQSVRRRFIQGGVIGLPVVILTLKSRAAWGQEDEYPGWKSKWESMQLGTSLDHTGDLPPGKR